MENTDLHVLTAPGTCWSVFAVAHGAVLGLLSHPSCELTCLPVLLSATITNDLLPLFQSSTSQEMDMKSLSVYSEAVCVWSLSVYSEAVCMWRYEHRIRFMSQLPASLTPCLSSISTEAEQQTGLCSLHLDLWNNPGVSGLSYTGTAAIYLFPR